MRRCLTIAVVLAASVSAGTAHAAPPANDDFDAAVEIATLPATFEVDTREAHDDLEDPDPSCSSAGASVWFRFTAPYDLMLRVDTYGSGYNTVLAVWRGTAEDDLTEVKCNDRLYGWDEAALTVGVHGGETVHVQAGGYSFEDLPTFVATGTLVLNASLSDGPVTFRPPPNDAIADATPVAHLPFDDYQETDSATLEDAEPPCPADGSAPYSSVWYRFAPAAPTPITISAFGWDQDITIGIFELWDGEFFPVRCRYDYGLYRYAQIELLHEARGGVTYMIQVATYNASYDGQAFGTGLSIDHADHADMLVRDLRLDAVTYETDAGPVLDPQARDIRFTIDRTSGPYLDGEWRIDACPGPASHPVGACTTIRSGAFRDIEPVPIRVRWNAVATGTVTVAVTLTSDWLADPDHTNDSARARTTFGPVHDAGVVVA